MTLFEKYRPTELDDIIGQPKAVAIVKTLQARGLGGGAYWITGKSGTGKTTLAKIIARDVCGDRGQIDEIDGASLNVATVEAWHKADRLQANGIMRMPGCHIVNEAHKISGHVQTRLLEYLENIPGNCAWIFTTTTDGREAFLFDDCDAAPFLSRCIEIELTQRGIAQPFAERALEIATAEGLAGSATVADLVKLANSVKSNFRAMLQRIQAGCLVA